MSKLLVGILFNILPNKNLNGIRFDDQVEGTSVCYPRRETIALEKVNKPKVPILQL